MIKESEVTVAGDIAGKDSSLFGYIKNRRKKPEKETKKEKKTMEGKTIFEDNDDWSFYNDNDMNVFEIKNDRAKEVYQMGLKRGQSNFWKQDPTTNEMLAHLNQNRSRNFVVRFDDQNSFPLMKGF